LRKPAAVGMNVMSLIHSRFGPEAGEVAIDEIRRRTPFTVASESLRGRSGDGWHQ
jgi:hypothetical protein